MDSGVSIRQIPDSITTTCQGGGVAEIDERDSNQIRTRNGRNGSRGKQEEEKVVEEGVCAAQGGVRC